MTKTTLSIITPCFNEAENVESCALKVKEIMETLLPEIDYEHIFADNSSTDSTVDKLRDLAGKDLRVKVIVNSSNVGPFRNIWNALKSVSGEVVIPMLPADLQDPPEVIPEMLEFWKKGNLVVYGVRKTREEAILMRLLRIYYYRIVKKMAAVEIPVNSGEFMLIDNRILRSILSTNDYYPYIRGLVAQTQVKSASVSYAWAARKHGKSKNSFLDLIDQGVNGLVSTSRLPARIILICGFFLSTAGVLFGLYAIGAKVVGYGVAPNGITAAISGIFVLGGIQLFFLGLLGEYILSIHGQVRRSPEMFEIERINFDNHFLKSKDKSDKKVLPQKSTRGTNSRRK